MMVSWARLSGSAACSNLVHLAWVFNQSPVHTRLLLPNLLGAAAAIVDPKVNAVIVGGEGM